MPEEGYPYCDPAEWDQCLVLDPDRGFLCTREKGHNEGPHVAHEAGSLRVVKVWADPDLEHPAPPPTDGRAGALR